MFTACRTYERTGLAVDLNKIVATHVEGHEEAIGISTTQSPLDENPPPICPTSVVSPVVIFTR